MTDIDLATLRSLAIKNGLDRFNGMAENFSSMETLMDLKKARDAICDLEHVTSMIIAQLEDLGIKDEDKII